jgi:hypothetical protein
MAQKNNLPEPVSNALAALNDVNFFDDSSAQPLPRTWIQTNWLKLHKITA